MKICYWHENTSRCWKWIIEEHKKLNTRALSQYVYFSQSCKIYFKIKLHASWTITHLHLTKKKPEWCHKEDVSAQATKAISILLNKKKPGLYNNAAKGEQKYTFVKSLAIKNMRERWHLLCLTYTTENMYK